MTGPEIVEAVARIMDVRVSGVHVGPLSTRVECSMACSYDVLRQLADALDTTDINFDYSQGEPGYSSWTPGTDSTFSFTIGIGHAGRQRGR